MSFALQLVDTTVEIANKVGAAEITSRIVEDLKDENEPYRKMVMDCIEKVGMTWNGEWEWNNRIQSGTASYVH